MTTNDASDESILARAAKTAGKAAAKVATLAGVKSDSSTSAPDTSAPDTSAPATSAPARSAPATSAPAKSKAGKLPKKDKQRLPRREKKAQQTKAKRIAEG